MIANNCDYKNRYVYLHEKIYQQPWLTLIHCSNFDYDAGLNYVEKTFIIYCLLKTNFTLFMTRVTFIFGQNKS